MTFRELVRARDWWDYKLPPLLAIAYSLVLAGEVPFGIAIAAIVAFTVFLGATAGFGYFLNDLCDVTADRAAAKRNAASEISPAKRALLLVGLLALALAPWLLLPRTLPILALVAAELGLFVAYSAPPLRLKSRGSAALVADALYAHTLPTLIAVLTFGDLGTLELGPWIALVASWSFIHGLRGILLHQVDDLRADMSAGIRTAVSPRTTARALFIVAFVLLPGEIVLFVALAFLLSGSVPWFVAYAMIVSGILALRARGEALRTNSVETTARTVPQRHRRFADFLGSWVLNDFFEKWMPLYPLVLLSIADPRFGIVATLHVLLFKTALPRPLLGTRK